MIDTDKLQVLIEKAGNLQIRDYKSLDTIVHEAESIFDRTPDNSRFLNKLKSINFSPLSIGASSQELSTSWTSGRDKIISFFKDIIEESRLNFFFENSGEISEHFSVKADEFFIWQFHDEEMRGQLEELLEKLTASPVLHLAVPGKMRFHDLDQIIPDLRMAIFLLSFRESNYPDFKLSLPIPEALLQEMFVQLGYFLGKLGPEKVLIFVREGQGIKKPSFLENLDHVVFTDKGSWKNEFTSKFQGENRKKIILH
ncbi:MAG: hypothetical protein PHW04_01640 [Candidatus Wallbacteria bacterium]|nr:hypothetical protein [Candidatus Wallbacteria bacterium]